MSSYKYAFLILCLLLPLAFALAAEAPIELISWDASGITLDSLIRADIAVNGVGGRLPLGRVYLLHSDSLYLVKRAIPVMSNDTMRIRAVNSGTKPKVWLAPVGTGTAGHRPPGYFLQATGQNCVIDVKNIMMSGMDEQVDTNVNWIQGAIVGATGSNVTTGCLNFALYMDGCIIKTANGNVLRTENTVHEVKVTNTIFADLGFLGTSNLGAGKAIDARDLRVDTLIFENCTFINWQDRIVRHYWSRAPLKLFKFNNNTLVNGMSYHAMLSLGTIDSSGTNPIEIKNNLLVDPYSLGGDTDLARSVEWNDGERDPNFPTTHYRPLWITAKTAGQPSTVNLQISNNYYSVTDTGKAFIKKYPYYKNEGWPLSYDMNARISASMDTNNCFKRVAIQMVNVPKVMSVMNRWYYTPLNATPPGGGKTKTTTTFTNDRSGGDPSNWLYDYDRRDANYYNSTLNCNFKSNATLTGIGDARWSQIGSPTDADVNLNGSMATKAVCKKGWNLVSIPREQLDYTPTSVFPGILGDMFAYSGGYVPAVTLEPGTAYWAFYENDTDVQIAGVALGSISVNLVQGWNFIGANNYTVPIADLQVTGAGSILGDIFKYAGGYAPVTELAPCDGHWVFIDGGACTVTIP